MPPSHEFAAQDCPAAYRGSVVFLAGNSDTQLKSFLPVISLLRARQGLPIAVLMLVSLYGDRQASGPLATLREMASEGVMARELVETDRPLRTRGLLGRAQLALRYGRELRGAFDALDPALLIVGTDITYLDQYAIRTARARGIPVIVLEDGLRSILGVQFRARRILKNLLGRGNAVFNARVGLSRLACSKLAVWGPADRDYYAARGVPGGTVTITGQPRFDVIRTRDWREDSRRAYDRLGVGSDELRLVFAPNWISARMDADAQVFGTTQLLSAIAGLRNKTQRKLRVIVKLPRVANNIAAFYSRIPESLLRGTITVADEDLYPLLHGCNVALTFYSTVGLEAMLFDKPVITLNFTGKPDVWDFASEGAALGVCDPGDLAPAIERALFDSATLGALAACRRNYLERRVSNLGRAAVAVCELACSLLSAGRRSPEEQLPS